ncbi:hypothetical protein BT96DRAFT_911915 [Gymnopus androsaceus JB14]|uniref:DUF6533 domain-containing protein n=1 Tax=Gymnopus androsaceus JB14 TaxID=1447944 RepID=A0A6A4ITD2_9AGAR|nr:hypothetical protein BT96DRAFT_911915 [Gymnopus androsaceus JB14]
MRAQIAASVFGLLITSCDSFLTRHKELEYVWSFRRPTFVWCLFILARYLAFSIHIASIILTSIWTVRFRGHQRPTEEVCMTWQLFQAATCYSMLLILEKDDWTKLCHLESNGQSTVHVHRELHIKNLWG